MDAQQMQLVDVKLIHPDPNQPRKHFSKESLQELADSMTALGQLEPMLVKTVGKGFKLIAGERRWRALQLAGIEKAKVLVDDQSDEKKIVMQQLDENLQREDLAPLEVGAGYVRLRELGMSVPEICERFKKKKSSVYAYCDLHKLPKEAKELLSSGHLLLVNAMKLTRVTPSRQLEATRAIADDYNPVMSEEDAARELERFQLDVHETPFDNSDATLCPKAGACISAEAGKSCPKVLQEGKRVFCLDSKCWEDKENANRARLAEQARKAGTEVVKGDAADNLIAAAHRSYGPKEVVDVSKLPASAKKALEEANVRKKLALGADAAVELVHVEHAREALKKAKVELPPELKQSSSSLGGAYKPRKPTEAEKKKRAAELLQQKVKARTNDLIFGALATAPAVVKGNDDFLRAVVLDFDSLVGSDGNKAFAKHLGKEPTSSWEWPRPQLKAHLRELKGAELRGALLQWAVARSFAFARNWGSGADFLAAAKLVGVDVEKLRAQAKAELEPKKKEKPKSASNNNFKKAAKKPAGKKRAA